MSGEPLVVIGIGHDGPAGLSAEALDHIARARVLAGGSRHLASLDHLGRETIPIGGDIAGAVRRLEGTYRQEKTVVLASGDPLFYGIGRALLAAIPRDELVFIPHLSSVQLAFARIKEPWDDARVVSLHGRPMGRLLLALYGAPEKIAVLTDPTNTPRAIADFLAGLDLACRYRLWVCENLGGPDERVASWSADELPDRDFSPLNVVVLLRTEAGEPPGERPPLVGIPDDAFRHAPGPRGMITKREVRVISLAYLELGPRDVLWDIGAGSGSISIEAARLSPDLRAFAVERDPDALADIATNVRRFGCAGVRVVPGEAPEILSGLPDPDAVFIGGSGGRLREIVNEAVVRLLRGGRIVLNCITMEHYSLGWDMLRERGLDPRSSSVQVAHSRPIGRLHRLEPENPILILRATKP
ncbi:MAG: precorrin-6y C5,15-methyltransferase (decarboxylating) subunit CbiE [Isosphaeraceae bacterium]